MSQPSDPDGDGDYDGPDAALEPEDLPGQPLTAERASALVAKQVGLPRVSNLITVYVSIGNSDDKLTQAEWAMFWAETQDAICRHADQIHGQWMSAATSRWQNACTAFEIAPGRAADLRGMLARVAAEFRQDSIAWAEAQTEFVSPAPRSGLDKARDAIRRARGGDAPVQVRGFA